MQKAANAVKTANTALNPIAGTPFENNEILTNDDMRRICAIFRFIMPKACSNNVRIYQQTRY